jgi:hypothetical protein
MTPYSRINSKDWENKIESREWLYQNPIDILIKASNGASDFGNKFGQPLIAGSILTFENNDKNEIQSYDKVIMLAGGIGYANKKHAIKEKPSKGDLIVIMGGDNYRIGMGGAAVSSADTGEFSSGIELNAIQRSNPEMQKRVANAIRGTIENKNNCIVSIHDHGAGGHLNCLTELVEETGGFIELDNLPIGDPTLSNKEIIGNESQERMGLIIKKENIDEFIRICEREKAPVYIVGRVTDDNNFKISSKKSNESCVDLSLKHFFGSSPKTILTDNSISKSYNKISYDSSYIHNYLEDLLSLEAVGCKDWLTNKVDRCVGGKVAKQQCVGQLQLPLNNCGVMALDFDQKLNVDGRGELLGEFRGEDRILVVSQNGLLKTIAPELTTHFNDDMIVLEKWIPKKPLSVVYFDGKKEKYFAKRFLVENENKEEMFISDNKGSFLELISTDWKPVIEVVFNKVRNKEQRESLKIIFDEFITIKGIKAQGNQLSSFKIKQVNPLEPIEYVPPIETPANEIEVIDEHVVDENIVNNIDNNDKLDDSTSNQVTLF